MTDELTPERVRKLMAVAAAAGHDPACDYHPDNQHELEPSCSCYRADRRALCAALLAAWEERDQLRAEVVGLNMLLEHEEREYDRALRENE